MSPALNVVFDLGGVVVTWDPGAIVNGVFDDPVERKLVLERVFGHADWVELDRGTLAREDAIERAAQRTGIRAGTLQELFEAIPRALVPVPEVVALVETLRAEGHPLFVLSNMHRASLAHLQTAYDVLELFDGCLISCEVGVCKPEPAIYRRLLSDFELRASSTVFIDDVQANLDAAAALGIRTVLFEDAKSCRARLRSAAGT